MWLLVHALSVAWAACPVPVETLRGNLEKGLEAARANRTDEVGGWRAQVTDDARCPAGIVEGADVARLHLLTAAANQLLANEAAATQAAAAAWSADPNLTPGEVAPEGTVLRQRLEAARTEPRRDGPRIRGDTWRVDGAIGVRHLAADRPAYLQRITTLEGMYLTGPTDPGAPPDLYPAHPHLPRTLAWTGGALALGAAGGIVTAAVLRDAYLDPTLSEDQAGRLVPWNIATGSAGIVLAAGAAGTLAGAVITGRW